MITAKRLTQLGFEKKEMHDSVFYNKENYILKPELGQWLICANHNGTIITTKLLIETEIELAKNYFESTGNKLL